MNIYHTTGKHEMKWNQLLRKYYSAITLSEGARLQSSLVFSKIRLDLHPWVHAVSFREKYTISLWEKLVAWPRCISGQYVGKVGEKAWKMPWETSGSPETGMVDRMGLHRTGGDFISRWRSRGARWLSSQEIKREEMIGTNYCGI